MLNNWFGDTVLLLCRIFKIVTLLFVVLFCVGFSQAAEKDKKAHDDVRQFMVQLESAADKIDSFRSDFVQEKELSLFAETMVFHGKLVVVRPDRLRWEFTDPVPSVFILNGDKGLRCSGEVTPVEFNLNSDPIMRSVAEQLWLWLGGDYSRLSDSFVLQKKDAASLLIFPKDSAVSEVIETVTIIFDLSTLQPQQVEIREPGGDLTRLHFSNYAFNIGSSDQLFTRCLAQPANDN